MWCILFYRAFAPLKISPSLLLTCGHSPGKALGLGDNRAICFAKLSGSKFFFKSPKKEFKDLQWKKKMVSVSRLKGK
jgi:hypothetical protein